MYFKRGLFWSLMVDGFFSVGFKVKLCKIKNKFYNI